MSEDRQETINTLRRSLEESSDSELYFSLAKLLAEDSLAESRSEARELCFKGLAQNPRHALGRLLLAKLFYEDRLAEFSLRELLELKKYTPAESLDRLIKAFGDFAHSFMSGSPGPTKASQGESETDEEEAVVAEFDLDTEFADVLDEVEG